MGIVKFLLFHLLLSFRRPILFTSKLLSLILLGCFASFFVIADTQQFPISAKVVTLSLGITFTLINWTYDYLIFYLTPGNLELRLYR